MFLNIIDVFTKSWLWVISCPYEDELEEDLRFLSIKVFICFDYIKSRS